MHQGPSEAKNVKIQCRDKGQINSLFLYTAGEEPSLQIQPRLLASLLPPTPWGFLPIGALCPQELVRQQRAWDKRGASPMTWRSSHLAPGLRKHSEDMMLSVYSQFCLCAESSSVNKGPNPRTDFLVCQRCCGLAKLEPGILVKENNMKCFMTGLWHSLKKPLFLFQISLQSGKSIMWTPFYLATSWARQHWQVDNALWDLGTLILPKHLFYSSRSVPQVFCPPLF